MAVELELRCQDRKCSHAQDRGAAAEQREDPKRKRKRFRLNVKQLFLILPTS